MTCLTALELCSGGGGTALGLEQAGFAHGALVETDADCCATLRLNRPGWRVHQADIARIDGRKAAGVDLLSAGLPCTPHSRGGKQLGEDDDRYLWDEALRIIAEAMPRAVMLETAKDILKPKFDAERAGTLAALRGLGYRTWWQEIDASGFGVPQRRIRAVLVALREPGAAAAFGWPDPVPGDPPAVGDVLFDLIAERGWPGAEAWRDQARDVTPVLVGGSKKHGGADLSGSQGKAAWRKLGIDPMGIADEAPGPDGKFARGGGKVFDAAESGVMLTLRMTARLQGFPDDWIITGRKTAAYRQVGNAFPPPAAKALGLVIAAALGAAAAGCVA